MPPFEPPLPLTANAPPEPPVPPVLFIALWPPAAIEPKPVLAEPLVSFPPPAPITIG